MLKVLEQFSEYAHSKGYKYALVGAYVYKRNKIKLTPYIELISCINGIMLLYESNPRQHHDERPWEREAIAFAKKHMLDVYYEITRSAT